MVPKPEQLYQDRIVRFRSSLSALERRNRRISALRLAVFLFCLALVYFFAQQGSSLGIVLSIGTGVVLFLALIRTHSLIVEQKVMQQAFLAVNKDELKAVQGNSAPFFDGNLYNDPEHPYCHDLDVFGPGSLFQYLNRTATVAGLEKLAALLSHPFEDKNEILSMQHVVEELSSKLEWRQNFQAIGVAYQENNDDRRKIIDWSESRPLFRAPLFKFLVVLIPVITLTMLLLLGFGKLPVQIFLLYLLIPWGFAGAFAMKVNKRHQRVDRTTEMLKKYAHLLHAVEDIELASGRFQKLRNNLFHHNISAGKSLKSLSAILTALDNRLNFLSWALLNGLFLWDILQMIRLESWQIKFKADLIKWFEVVGEFDVINCLANFRFNNPDTIFPEMVDNGFDVQAFEVGHPLIDPEIRVNNEFRIREGEFLIITGANMAGKSTYLRTIGINLILAMCGGPVCASRFSFSPVHIYTSIRTSDSLKENESYFYAELRRLKAIIDELRNGKKLFIILDEILKGTNSKDKHAGSEALLKQLVSFGATGMVATHDVLLGKLSEKFPANIRNHCFEVEIEGDQLHFDYLLKDGISKNLNATLLMREMGITI